VSPPGILFLCVGNSARSILAEALLAYAGGSRLRVYSAGSAPRGEIHPDIAAFLADFGIGPDAFRSKSWFEFLQPGAPEIDIVITLCFEEEEGTCPLFPGNPLRTSWALPDPVRGKQGERASQNAIARTAERLRRRIGLLLASFDGTRSSLLRTIPDVHSRASATEED